VAKVLWTLCYASPEEFPELQRPRRATGNRRNLQCGDDSIMQAKATRDMGSPCLGVVGASVWGGRPCWLSKSLCWYLALLIEHELSSPQHPAQGGVTFPGILFMTWRAQGVMNGWLLVFLYRMCCRKASCAVVRLWHFRVFGGNPARYRQLVVISDPAFKQGQFSYFLLPFDFVVGTVEYRSVF